MFYIFVDGTGGAPPGAALSAAALRPPPDGAAAADADAADAPTTAREWPRDRVGASLSVRRAVGGGGGGCGVGVESPDRRLGRLRRGAAAAAAPSTAAADAGNSIGGSVSCLVDAIRRIRSALGVESFQSHQKWREKKHSESINSCWHWLFFIVLPLAGRSLQSPVPL